MYFFKEITMCQSVNRHEIIFFIDIEATHVFVIYTKRDKFSVFKFLNVPEVGTFLYLIVTQKSQHKIFHYLINIKSLIDFHKFNIQL